MPIKQIITASGWYFVHGNGDGKVTAYPLAAWAHNDDGKVVGMISVKGGGNNSVIGDVCRLVIVPFVPGVYKHQEEMLPHEMESVRQGIPIDVPSGPHV